MDFFKKASDALGGNAQDSDYLKQAEGFLQSQGGSGSTPQSTDTPATEGAPTPAGESAETPSTTDSGKAGYSSLIGNAQTLYQGIQDKASGKSGVSDQQMADAASDVLKAADSAGLGKDSPYGQYIEKAQGYLQNYGDKGGAAPTSDAPAPAQ